MENEIKIGDKVRTLEPIGTAPKGTIGIVQKTYEDGAVCLLIAVENGISNIYCWPSELEIVQTKEQMEEANLNQWQSELDALNKEELDKMQHPERQYTYETAMDWVKYEAQLAHDIAVKIVGNDIRCPKDIGNYAVSIAQAVVDGLKKK